MAATKKTFFGWGTGIVTVYLMFVLGIVMLVSRSCGEKVDLVTPDYYAKELRYQEQIEKLTRSKALTEGFSFKMTEGNVALQFPSAKASGSVLFFRPSDKDADQTIEIRPDSTGLMMVYSSSFQPGLYKMSVDWQLDGIEYLNEESIVFPK